MSSSNANSTVPDHGKDEPAQGGGLLGGVASGLSTTANTAGTAVGGLLGTAGDVVNVAAKGTGDTLQKTVGTATGQDKPK